MALYSTDHSLGLARDLTDRLTLRMENNSGINTFTQQVDSAGWPEIVASHGGTVSESNPVVLIRFIDLQQATDIFGNTTYAFTPTTGQLAYELTSGGAPIPSAADLFTITSELTRDGTVLQQYAVPNGTAVTDAQFTAANLVQTLNNIDFGPLGNT